MVTPRMVVVVLLLVLAAVCSFSLSWLLWTTTTTTTTTTSVNTVTTVPVYGNDNDATSSIFSTTTIAVDVDPDIAIDIAVDLHSDPNTIHTFTTTTTNGNGDGKGIQEERDKIKVQTTSSTSTSTSTSTVVSIDIVAGVRKYASSTDPDHINAVKEEESSSSFSSSSSAAADAAQKKKKKKKKTLHIHVVPHTHDDVGWLKTIAQYYQGWNQTIQEVSVREILTTVVEALEENPARTFTYVEIKFFALWWQEQTAAVQQRVHRLVTVTKQLTFVNGGWCMHDEAATHYMGMIDQTTLGHDFLKQTFDYVPTVGWQLDPFGHSSTQSSLMTYHLGFDALYFGRIDYQDLALRHATKECEGLWNTVVGDRDADADADTNGDTKGSTTTSNSDKNTNSLPEKNEKKEGSIFWGLTGSYYGNYGPPGGWCFDEYSCGPNNSLIRMNHTTLVRAIEDFLLAVRQQSDRTQGDHVMLTIGEDFQYQRASTNFANLDLLLGTVARAQQQQQQEDPAKQEPGATTDHNDDHDQEQLDILSLFGPEYTAVNMFYSSPEYYTLCKYNETMLSSQKKKKRSERKRNNNNNMTNNNNNHHLRSSSEYLTTTATATTTDHRRLSNHDDNQEARDNKERISNDEQEQAQDSDNDNDNTVVEYSIKRDDFFPYSDCPNCFWTGYFSSRPALKRFERVASSFLLAVRQIEAATLLPVSSETNNNEEEEFVEEVLCGAAPMHQLEDAVGVVQHHDGVSGTSKQHVAYDYAKQLQAGIDAVIPCTIRKLKRLLLLRTTTSDTTTDTNTNTNTDSHDDHDHDNSDHEYLKDLTYCQLLNETKCEVSVEATRRWNSYKVDVYVVVYNSLASQRSVVIDLPVGSSGNYLVEALENNGTAEIIAAQRSPFHSAAAQKEEKGGSLFVLSFSADRLPAVGGKVFRIRKQTTTAHIPPAASTNSSEEKSSIRSSGQSSSTRNIVTRGLQSDDRHDGWVEISNGQQLSVLVNTHTGDIHRIGSRGRIEKLSMWGYYTSFDAKQDGIERDGTQNSGAYIFRPSTPNQQLIEISPTNATIVQHNSNDNSTSSSTEIHTEYEESWIKTVTRIRTGRPYVEIEYQVGPIPIGDGRGKEVVTRYNTMVDNDGIFYTDSNGREFIQRRRNHRPTWDLTVFEPIAGNYYPVTTGIYVDEITEEVRRKNKKDLRQTPPAAFAVVTDRTQGGGSILDGTLELMVHRRTLVDDARGVGEALNETEVGITSCPPYGNATRLGEGLIIRGTHRILVEHNKNANNNNDDDDDCHKEELTTCGGRGGARLARSLMDASFAEPLVFVGSSPSLQESPFRVNSFSSIQHPLPKNVMLITKKRLFYNNNQEAASTATATSYLVRLGHQYGQGEDPDLSLPVDIDLSLLFPRQVIQEVRETTVSGNRDRAQWEQERLDWAGTKKMTRKENTLQHGKNIIITLCAMDIRTFIVTMG